LPPLSVWTSGTASLKQNLQYVFRSVNRWVPLDKKKPVRLFPWGLPPLPTNRLFFIPFYLIWIGKPRIESSFKTTGI
jgi:hypothetical protein